MGGSQASGTQVRLVRHGETQSYARDCGLTARGSEQARRLGRDLARGLLPGLVCRVACADTERARATAADLRLGLLDGTDQARRGDMTPPVVEVDELRNFQVATPDGLADITAVFQRYESEAARADGAPAAGWVADVGRFWQQHRSHGDPIGYWLRVPMLNLEPPASTARRLWRGIRRLAVHDPGDLIVCVTHSGPMRALAAAAFGEDLGEPDNLESVLVGLEPDRRTATVAYRGRSVTVEVPDLGGTPAWWEGLDDPDGGRRAR